jgi:hypothetical protein
MNTSNLIFQLVYIHGPPKLIVLTPRHSPYTPFVDYAITFTNCVNTSIDCTDTSTNYANKSANCAHASNDYVNTYVDSTNTLNIPTIDF